MWRLQIAAGLAWIVITAAVALLLFRGASAAADAGLIAEPARGQALVAGLSALVFGLPGAALAAVGWQHRKRE